jgi:hypothetical protein
MLTLLSGLRISRDYHRFSVARTVDWENGSGCQLPPPYWGNYSTPELARGGSFEACRARVFSHPCCYCFTTRKLSRKRSNEIVQVYVLGVTFARQHFHPITGGTDQSHEHTLFDYEMLATYPPCGRVLVLKLGFCSALLRALKSK